MAHVQALHKLGATRAELDEMLGLCVYMGGGPALMYCAEAIGGGEAHGKNCLAYLAPLEQGWQPRNPKIQPFVRLQQG